jgi:hypothetical protein
MFIAALLRHLSRTQFFATFFKQGRVAMRSQLQLEEFERNLQAAFKARPAAETSEPNRLDDQAGVETIHDWDDVSYDWFDTMDFDVGVGD